MPTFSHAYDNQVRDSDLISILWKFNIIPFSMLLSLFSDPALKPAKKLKL